MGIDSMAGIVGPNSYAFLGAGTVSKPIMMIGIMSEFLLLVSRLLIFKKI